MGMYKISRADMQYGDAQQRRVRPASVYIENPCFYYSPPHARSLDAWPLVFARDHKAVKKLAVKLARTSGHDVQTCTKFLEALPEAVATVLTSSQKCLVPKIAKFKAIRIPIRPRGTTKSICGRIVELKGMIPYNKVVCVPTLSFTDSVLEETLGTVPDMMANEVDNQIVQLLSARHVRESLSYPICLQGCGTRDRCTSLEEPLGCCSRVTRIRANLFRICWIDNPGQLTKNDNWYEY